MLVISMIPVFIHDKIFHFDDCTAMNNTEVRRRSDNVFVA